VTRYVTTELDGLTN